MVGICNAHKVRIMAFALIHRVVPAQVASHNLVVAVLVLNNFWEKVVIRVGGAFGWICDKKAGRSVGRTRVQHDGLVHTQLIDR